jgi:hypothetical protein
VTRVHRAVDKDHTIGVPRGAAPTTQPMAGAPAGIVAYSDSPPVKFDRLAGVANYRIKAQALPEVVGRDARHHRWLRRHSHHVAHAGKSRS